MNRASATPTKQGISKKLSVYGTAMASYTTPHSLKGYDHQFIDQPPDDLLCLICLSAARDPQQLTCCGKVLCKVCLEDLKKHSNDCPQCRKPIVSFPDTRSKLKENSRIHVIKI